MSSKRYFQFLIPAVLAAVWLCLLSGCAGVDRPGGGKHGRTLATGEPRPMPFESNARQTRKAAVLSEDPIHVDDSRKDDQAGAPERKFEMPGRSSSQRGSATQTMAYPDNLIRSLPDPKSMVTVELAFNAADLSEVVAAFAAPSMLNFSYMIDPAVKGAVTLSVDTRMTAAEAWETFEHILWLSGAYASMNTGFIHILPFDKMPQERRIFADHKAQPNVIVDFITIRYKKSAEVISQIKPFITEGASLTDLPDSNTVVIVEAPANIAKLRELIARIDGKGEREWPCATFQCREVDAETLAAELNNLMPVLGFPVATGTGSSGGAIKIVPLPRVGCVVVSAAMPEVVSEVGKWVKALDRSDMLDKEEIYFYNVTHTTVEKLSSALDAFFNTITTTNSSTLGGGTSSRSSATSGSLENNSTSSSSSSRNSRSSRSSRSSSSAGRNSTTSTTNRANAGNAAASDVAQSLNTSIFDTEVTVFADEESNRLTIKTTPRAWTLLKAFLDRHDVPSRQVSIRAIIADISLDKSTEFGVSYAASKLFSHGDWNAGGAWAGAGAVKHLQGTADAVVDTISSWSSQGLGLIIQNANDPLALVTAVAGEGKTKILSEPQLVVVSGSEAFMQAGNQIAVPTQTTNYTSSSGNTSTNYEYRDTGVIMTVTPYITAGNEVRLTIEQEVSDVAASSATSATNSAPNFTTKKVNTEMTVKDNSTILMGGMIRNSETITKGGIPFLRDIPYLGYLFGYDKKSVTRTELLILITVNVIDNENFQDELIRRYKTSLEEIAKHQGESY